MHSACGDQIVVFALLVETALFIGAFLCTFKKVIGPALRFGSIFQV